MESLSKIDINSVFIHKSFAVNKSQTIYVNTLDNFGKDGRYKCLHQEDYNCYVIISGLYKNGDRFKRMECRISPEGYRQMKEQDRVIITPR